MTSQSRAPPIRIQPKNASTLAPVTVGDADSVSSLLETIPRDSFEQSLASQKSIPSSISLSSAVSTEPGASVQLRVSIAVDSEQHYEKLVKAKVHIVLVLTALVQLPNQRIWIEQGRTELMSLPKGHLDGHFVKTLSLQIQDNFLVIGFTLLVVPPSGTSPKVIALFPGLDGFIPWAESTVAIEHFVLESSSGTLHHKHDASISHRNINFSTPLMDIALPPNAGLRKSKHTVAILNVTVEEILPKEPFAKLIAERQRVGPSFCQTYTGHSVRGTAIYGREYLYESPLAFTLPIKLLQLLAQDERKVIQELEKEHDVSLSDLIQAIPLDHQPNPMTRRTSFIQTLRGTGTRPSLANEETLKSAKVRQLGLASEDAQIQKLLRQQICAHRNIEVYYETMVQKVEQKLRVNMEVGQGPFRRSPEKKDESVQWIPLNCCVQELLVHDDGYQTNYQTTTVGAAAAHSVGFNRTMSVDDTGKAPSMGVFWSKQEQGNNLIRDLRALQEVLTSCATEFNELLMACLSSARSFEGGRHTRIQALVKEIEFLNDEIISFGSFILHDYLTSLSTESTARHICEEIESLVKRMKLIEFMDPSQEQQQQEQGGPGWLSDSKQKIKEVVNYTRDLSGFIGVAVQHECLVTDATLVASPEWIVAKRTRECCLSQLTTALATSFLAILEDWWSNIAIALQHGGIHGAPSSVHSATCKHGSSRSMEHIDEEGSPTIKSLEILHAESIFSSKTGEPRGALRRLSSSSKANGKSKPRRNSVQSTSSNHSFASSRSGSFTRSKSFSRHPLDHLPVAKAQNDKFWDQLMSLGWLVQIESLLSTQGSELGMLQDYAQAVIDVRDSVTINFHCLPMSTPSLPTASQSPSSSKLPLDADDLAESRIQVSGRRGQLTVSFGLDPLQFSMLPEPLKSSSAKIQMLPVLFSQGINEMQTISNLTGKNSIQHSINEDGLRQMQAYVARYKAWQSQSRAIQAQKELMSTSHIPSRSRSFGPHATRRGDVSAASLMSNLTSEWDMVTPTRAEPWNGENLVIDLLDHLEMAILGHADETRSLVDSSSGSINESNNSGFQISYSPQTVVSETSSRARVDTGPGVATGILGSMMEYGSTRLFGTRGSKDTEILECAEALTRALGQVKPLHDVPPQSDPDSCECQETPTSAPSSPLWVTTHVVSCKSAKDRTSMSVTLSQVNLLKNCHGLKSNPDHNGQDDEDHWQAILDAMRSEIGVRIKNVERNLKLGEFAKDLLWISAFGSGNPSPPSERIPSQPSPTSSTHESLVSPQVKDALTLVRSLLPAVSLPSPQGDSASGATEDSNGDELADDGVLVEHEARDISSSTIPIASPTTLDSPPPPLKLVRHITGLALEPEMTVDSNAQFSPNTGSVLSQPLDIPDGLCPSITEQDGQYTSFPESFDEPQLAQLLARSLGLDSFGLSSGSATEGSNHHGRPLSQKKTFDPKTGFSATTTSAHRSTPSWSSQQSVYYQQQQHPPTSSSTTPSLKKRISALGLGLGLGLGSSSKPKAQHSPSSSLDSTTPSSSLSQPMASSSSSSYPQEPPRPTLSSSSSSSSAFYDGKGQKGKFAFNRVQLKFLPAAYRPPRRMTTNTFES
ncbi:Phosphatidylinositol 3,4,5-trisphosphate-dependent Rac exchanger 2 protein [Podila verticillata]|nr:Phosphatidylinositol 3,4,5-trisphosphate-dependent Rac exchanger 2 protein [Podila verticillata]